MLQRVAVLRAERFDTLNRLPIPLFRSRRLRGATRYVRLPRADWSIVNESLGKVCHRSACALLFVAARNEEASAAQGTREAHVAVLQPLWPYRGRGFLGAFWGLLRES